MLRITEVSLRRGPRLLLDQVSLTAHVGDRIGVLGGNGSGKSSLFALLRGELAAEAGEVDLPAAWTIAHVAQETPALAISALDYVLDGDREWRRLSDEIAACEAAGDGQRLATLLVRYENMGGYSAHARAGRLLHGLGFSSADEARPVRDFSGGWRMRLNLAQALFCPSDLLLLDEPTNHLDLDAVLWLEEWLRGYRGTLLLISHDRAFLDNVVSHIAALEGRKIILNRGNYTAYEEERAARLERQQAAFDKQQREIGQMEKFVARFRAKASKARQAQSRLKALERMQRLTPAHVDSPFHFEFAPADRLPSPLIHAREMSLGYAGHPVLEKVTLSILPGARLALLGPNGAGKSTLIKALAGQLAPNAGEFQCAKDLAVGYFAQHQLEQLHEQDTPLSALGRVWPRATEQQWRDFLGGFDFSGDAVHAEVGRFSGGEKARLVLAQLVAQKPNLLLLDEPTNHLDMEMRRALSLALQDFSGAVVLVSHDRGLLDEVCDDWLLVADGRVAPFEGDLADYRQWWQQRRREEPSVDPAVAPARGVDRKAKRQQAAAQRARLKPLRDEIRKAEKDIQTLQQRLAAIEGELAVEEIYQASEKPRLTALLTEQGEKRARLVRVEEAWLDLSEQLEAAEAADGEQNG